MLFKHGLAGLAKVPAASGLTKTFLGASSDTALPANTTAINFTGVAEGDQVYLAFVKVQGTQSNGMTAATVEGSSATLVGSTSSSAARTKCYLYKIACPAAAADNASAAIGYSGLGVYAVGAWKISATPATETVTANQYTTNTSPMVGSVNTVSGGVLIGVGVFEDISTGLTWTGASEDAEITADGGTKRIEWVSAAIASTESPRTVTAAHTGATSNDHGAIITVALS